MKSGVIITALVVVMMLVVSNAYSADIGAQKQPVELEDESKIRVGFYSTDLDTNLQLDSSDGDDGTDISFEGDLGFPTETNQVWVDINWKQSERNYIDISYVKIDRSTTHTIEREIDFGDQVFEIGTIVDAFFDTDYLLFSYRRALTKNERGEFGASLGVGSLWLTTGIEAIGGPSTGEQQNTSVTAPFPVLGIHGYQQLSQNLYLTSSAEYFSAAISNIDFTVTNFRVGLDYYLSQQFGLGIRYDYNLFKADVERSSFTGSVDYLFDGLEYYVIYNF